MMFLMTRQAKNFKILNSIIMPVVIYVMNLKFTAFLKTSIAMTRVMLKSKFSIASNSCFKGMVFIKFRVIPFFRIKSSYFHVHTLSRAMNSMRFAWANSKWFQALRTNFSDLNSGVVLVKTRFAAKYITVIKSVDFKSLSTLFAAFRFPDFSTRSSVACFTAVNLPFVIPRNFLITLFAIHANECIGNTLTSQSL